MTDDIRVGDLPMQTRQASFEPSTYDSAARTVDLVWSTGAKVRRSDFWTGQKYDESLSLDAGHVDLSRLNAGAPLLQSHNGYSLDGQIGVVERAWIDRGEGHATVRFSDREAVKPILQDVQDGILRNVSVGYNVRKYEVTEGDTPEYRAIDWTPMEISLVSIPADAGASVRSGQPATPCLFSRAAAPSTLESTMTTETIRDAVDDNTPPVDLDAVRVEAAALERKRCAGITELCRKHGLADLGDQLIASDASIHEARAAVLDALATRQPDIRPPLPRAEITRDETDTRRAGIENALMHRIDPGMSPLQEIGHDWTGRSLTDMARQMLERKGESTRGMDKLTIATRALQSSSDFPYVLANVANKTLRAAYDATPRTFLPFSRMATAPDFKTIQRTAIGDAPALKQVNEHGEFTYGGVSEAKETYQLATYGRIVALTRQAIINDDLNAFSRLAQSYGVQAAQLESDVVWGILTTNAALNDGIALFYATHGNLAGSAAAISVTSLSAARAAMMVQTSLDGVKINVQARYLLVPAALYTVAQQYTTASGVVASTQANYNPFAGTLQVIAEPRLDTASTTAWYLAADPGQIDTVEYCYLEGQQGVYLEDRIGFEVDGIEYKARMDFGAKAIDYRGLYKNAGA